MRNRLVFIAAWFENYCMLKYNNLRCLGRSLTAAQSSSYSERQVGWFNVIRQRSVSQSVHRAFGRNESRRLLMYVIQLHLQLSRRSFETSLLSSLLLRGVSFSFRTVSWPLPSEPRFRCQCRINFLAWTQRQSSRLGRHMRHAARSAKAMAVLSQRGEKYEKGRGAAGSAGGGR